MLMDDHETICADCSAKDAAPSTWVPSSSSVVGAGSTAVLERSTAVPMPAAVQYRVAGSGRRVGMMVLVLVLAVVALGVLAVMAVRGDGPLADLAVESGLVAPPLVDVPDEWVAFSSGPGRFEVALPAGATPAEVFDDPANPAAASTFGFEADLGEGGSTAVISTDFGMAPGSLDLMDDPVAFDELVGVLVGGLTEMSESARETVRREVPVGYGRAMDVVVVDDEAGMTSRARFLLADGRVLAVMTTGLDAGAEELDEVHARVIDSLTPIG
jgi:hypothetical protein